jgi:hypothetical protein
MEVIITFLARGRKVGESDLGALLSAVTEKCPGQDKGKEHSRRHGVLLFQFCGCWSKREGD